MERGGTITILCVDDDADNLDLLAARLERADERLSVVRADSVEAAWQTFENASVDCVVSDYHLEGATGVDLLERVRQDRPDVPFFILTGTGTEASASEAISAGVTDYMVRDVSPEQYELLAEKITREVEYQRNQAEARRTNQLLHELADNARDVLWVFSGDWSELLFVNQAYREVFGRSPEELYDAPTSFLDAVHPEDVAELSAAMEDAVEGQARTVTYRIDRDDGETRWLESQGQPITDEDGHVVRIAGYSRDVTARKERERELQETNEQLDLFTSVVAHDLRNPLSVAKGNLQLVREEGSMDRIPPIERSLDRMDQLITDLLTLARQGDSIDEVEPVSLERLASEYWQNVAKADAELRVVDDPTIECDPSRLGQAFENLYRNALEHSSGPVTVEVGALADGDGFYVEDNGPGIPEENRQALLEGTYSDAAGDLRFGVAIVRRVVEAHGWTIDIRDAAGGGTRFEISGLGSASN